MHYLRAGTGRPVVLLHGTPQHAHMWRPVMRVLAERFDVIAPDLRGAGGSQATETGYDKASMAQDIHQLLEHLGVTEPVGIVGHDMDAGVAYAYATARREHVRRLGFLEFALPGFGFEQAMQARPDAENWQLAFFASAPDMAHRLLAGREDDLLAWYFGHAADHPYAVTATDRSLYAQALRAPGALRAMLSYFATIWQDAEHNRHEAATALNIPVLAVGGARSAADGPRRSMEQVANNVRGVVLDGAGHWRADEQPDALSAAPPLPILTGPVWCWRRPF